MTAVEDYAADVAAAAADVAAAAAAGADRHCADRGGNEQHTCTLTHAVEKKVRDRERRARVQEQRR